MRVSIEIAELAQALRLTTQLGNPKIVALLQQYLATMAKPKDEPLEMPKPRGAVNHMFGWADYCATRSKPDPKAVAERKAKLEALEREREALTRETRQLVKTAIARKKSKSGE